MISQTTSGIWNWFAAAWHDSWGEHAWRRTVEAISSGLIISIFADMLLFLRHVPWDQMPLRAWILLGAFAFVCVVLVQLPERDFPAPRSFRTSGAVPEMRPDANAKVNMPFDTATAIPALSAVSMKAAPSSEIASEIVFATTTLPTRTRSLSFHEPTMITPAPASKPEPEPEREPELEPEREPDPGSIHEEEGLAAGSRIESSTGALNLLAATAVQQEIASPSSGSARQRRGRALSRGGGDAFSTSPSALRKQSRSRSIKRGFQTPSVVPVNGTAMERVHQGALEL